MLTMSLILWRCKKRDRWNQSVLYRTERSGDLNDARNRDSSAFLQRNHNENELFNRDNDHTSSGHCSSSQSLEGYTCLTVRLPDKTQNNTCLHPVLKGDKEQKATFDNQVES
ncbi:uncharacterized protein LOC133187835 [Saccostrea echinata]|uniref:uncharacterized protein LOC133187835 n=1 Tax=Saccostrea echinata TaxID=191078 RepID=UPI002A821F9E|nr:uncharacterized protein LOC133187835 [Saccostrea echinata]